MIDLHCHLLPGIDDGAPDLPTALRMARMAVADGITHCACTPHIYPGLYENDRDGIATATATLREALRAEGIQLELAFGADTHLAPDLLERLQAGLIPTLNDSRYLLLEPPHHVAPPRFEEAVFQLMVGGYVPIITHPERLTWIESHYEVFGRMARAGVWMQLTAGSLTGRFGRRPKYWAERMVQDGVSHILATDAHHPDRRPPLLAEGREALARILGDDEATHHVFTRPLGILRNNAPSDMPEPHARPAGSNARNGFWQKLGIGA